MRLYAYSSPQGQGRACPPINNLWPQIVNPQPNPARIGCAPRGVSAPLWNPATQPWRPASPLGPNHAVRTISLSLTTHRFKGVPALKNPDKWKFHFALRNAYAGLLRAVLWKPLLCAGSLLCHLIRARLLAYGMGNFSKDRREPLFNIVFPKS